MPGNSLKRVVTIKNERGLHARAAAKFVQLAQNYDADVKVSRENLEVSGHSIMGLLMLAAHPGTEIELKVEGQEADKSLSALEQLVDNLFNEEK